MKNKTHEDCNCEHHNSDGNEKERSHICPSSQFVEKLLKSLEIEVKDLEKLNSN